MHEDDLFLGKSRFSTILRDEMSRSNDTINTIASIATVSPKAVEGWLSDHSFPHLPSFEKLYIHYHMGNDLKADFFRLRNLQKPYRKAEDEARESVKRFFDNEIDTKDEELSRSKARVAELESLVCDLRGKIEILNTMIKQIQEVCNNG